MTPNAIARRQPERRETLNPSMRWPGESPNDASRSSGTAHSTSAGSPNAVFFAGNRNGPPVGRLGVPDPAAETKGQCAKSTSRRRRCIAQRKSKRSSCGSPLTLARDLEPLGSDDNDHCGAADGVAQVCCNVLPKGGNPDTDRKHEDGA